jgi:protocatechuate 3,4-dioxygenase beta subunit
MKVNDHFVSIRRLKLIAAKLFRRPAGGTNFWPIAAALCALVGLMSAPLRTESANSPPSTSPQSQLVPIGILFFQDESGMNAPADLGQKIAKDLQQKLAVNYKDVLPRMLNPALDASASGAMNVEQVVTLGKQHGVKFVVRGGLLAVTTENAGEETKIGVQLYASITSVESASDNNVRAEGSGTQKGPVAELSSVDLKTAGFRGSALDQALSAATAQLASSIHDVITASASTTAATERVTPDSSAGTAETEAAQAATADQELQQLIAQAESTLAGNPNSSTENINALRQALEGLKSALAAKASRLEENKDTAAADQEIATRKQEMQTALANLTAEASASDTSAQIQQPSGEKKSFLARIGEFASEATSLLQKIQELRSTLRSLREDDSANQGAPQDPTSSQDPGAPTEQTTGEVTGTVTEDGNPVEGAIVTGQEGGGSVTTDINGLFNLKGLTPGRLVQLTVVAKNGRVIGRGQVDVLGGRAAIADFQTTSRADGRIPVTAMPGVLTSSLVGNRARTPGLSTGTLKGVVRDVNGRPVPFALVQVPGVGMARTNAQGQYSFVNVPVGIHELTIRQSGMKPKSSQVTVAAQTNVEARTQFAAADTITRGRQSLIHVSARTVLRGTVLDNQTHPLDGAKISVIQSETTVSVLTAPAGTYELRNLKPGFYIVSVYKVGYQVARQTVTLKAAATEQRNFQLSPLASAAVNKLIKNAIASQGEVRGVVRTQTGTPIANASIEVRSAGRPFLIARALTNSRGEYALRLAEGGYDLKARQQSFQDDNNRVSVRAGGATRADFELRQTRTSTTGTAVGTTTLRPPVILKGQLAGRVTDGNGKPVAEAIIALQRQRRTTTDRDGNYTVAQLTPNSYRITVIKAGFTAEEKTIDVRGGISTRRDFVLKTAGGAIRQVGRLPNAGIVLARTGHIAGRVIDGKTGAPLAGVNVSIAGQRTVTTGANGSYSFTNVAFGTYQVTARKSGFTEGQKSVSIRGTDTVPANFSLTSTSVRPSPILRRP